MRIAVIGAGAVGARAARQLASTDDVEAVFISAERADAGAAVAASLGEKAFVLDGGIDSVVTARPDAVVVACTTETHAVVVQQLLAAGLPSVSTSDAVREVRTLLALDPEARERGVTVVVGAGFSPGLTCVLARHAAAVFDQVDEIHVAKTGTGGPDCARQHHRALAEPACDWRDGAWVERSGGSGRELCWFPDPIGPQDCYRAALPDALLLVGAFPGVSRVTARIGANRRDRITSKLPMLRPPHPEGGPGAVRVEVRGQRGPAREVEVMGAIDRPAVAAGAVAALAAVWVAGGRLQRTGAAGLGELVDPVPFLGELARRGVKAALFEGVL